MNKVEWHERHDSKPMFLNKRTNKVVAYNAEYQVHSDTHAMQLKKIASVEKDMRACRDIISEGEFCQMFSSTNINIFKVLQMSFLQHVPLTEIPKKDLITALLQALSNDPHLPDKLSTEIFIDPNEDQCRGILTLLTAYFQRAQLGSTSESHNSLIIPVLRGQASKQALSRFDGFQNHCNTLFSFSNKKISNSNNSNDSISGSVQPQHIQPPEFESPPNIPQPIGVSPQVIPQPEIPPQIIQQPVQYQLMGATQPSHVIEEWHLISLTIRK